MSQDIPSKPNCRSIWANGGVLGPTGDIYDPGNDYIEKGWPLSTTPSPRQYFNWMLNWLSNGVRYYSRAGISDYDAAEVYQVGDITRDTTDGHLYRCIVANTIALAPSATPTNWGPLQVVSPPSINDSSAAVVNTNWVTAKLGGYALVGGSYSGMTVGNATNAANANFATTAGTANNVAWSGVGGRPTTVAGYGITDAVTTAGGVINGQVTINSNLLIKAGAGLYLNAGTNNIVCYTPDNSNVAWGMPGSMLINGQIVATENWVSGNFLTPGTANATYLTIANAAATYVQLGAFGSSLGSTGYQRLPGGMIMQWGYATTFGGIGAITTVTFPITFPNACLAAFCNTGLRNSQGSQGTNFVTGFGASFLQVLFDSIVNASGYTGGYWFAIGH